MQSKILLKRILFITSITAIVFYIIILFIAPILHNRLSYAKTTPQNPIDNKAVAPLVSIKQESVGLPVRLKIPSINIDAAIEYVGLKANGEMGVPKDTANVAWFKLGSRPGENGSAVIAGHFGVLENGEGSVFDNLKKLGRGDKIYVEDEKGTTITFVVREKRSYEADEDASGVFSSNDGKSHLNLVTCQGWNIVSESYTKRLVIFTDKE